MSDFFEQSPYQARNFPQSLRFALKGIARGLRTQRNLRAHLLITLLVVALGCFLALDRWEWVSITFAIGLMWLAELLNTAIEWLVDVYTQHTYHELGGQIKDIAAGACLIVAGVCVLVGLLVFWPHLVGLLMPLAS
ncbi:MAG: diacylglycerol kinase family protein [Vampirovibrionales bacterium]|nr:diacylglycerol kinase family protein [Vampirovibrionales bacterium]